jgi:hypothetical protein
MIFAIKGYDNINIYTLYIYIYIRLKIKVIINDDEQIVDR